MAQQVKTLQDFRDEASQVCGHMDREARERWAQFSFENHVGVGARPENLSRRKEFLSEKNTLDLRPFYDGLDGLNSGVRVSNRDLRLILYTVATGLGLLVIEGAAVLFRLGVAR